MENQAGFHASCPIRIKRQILLYGKNAVGDQKNNRIKHKKRKCVLLPVLLSGYETPAHGDEKPVHAMAKAGRRNGIAHTPRAKFAYKP